MAVRILQILHSMNRGGAENALMNYYRHIDRNLLQFAFLITDPCHCQFEDEIVSLGGKIYRLPPLSKRNPWSYILKAISFFKEHTEYNIVHSHTSSKSVLPLFIAKMNGVPIRISHSHNTQTESGLNGVIRNFLKWPLKRVATDFFACGVEAGIWLYGKQLMRDGKVIVMPNVIEGSCFDYSPIIRQRVRQKLGLSLQTLLIGCVARFSKQKNHTFLLDIFSDFLKREQNSKLILLGDGELHAELHDKACRLGINNQILWLGVVPNVAEYEQAMDVFVMPSLYEGLPLSVVEAQISGLPCIASDTITQEVNLTGLVNYLPINKGTTPWIEELLKVSNEGRRSYLQEIIAKGYDAEASAIWLQNYYLERLKKARV